MVSRDGLNSHSRKILNRGLSGRVKVSEFDAHSNPLQTVPHDSNGAVEFAIRAESQPQLDLLSGWRRILSLNKNTNRADIRPPSCDFFVALFEVNVVDQFDPFIPTGVGRSHEESQSES